MFYTVIAGICLAASGATPAISAQHHQNPIGFVLPTVAKLPGFTGLPSEAGWPAPPPPPPPPTPASADCPLSSIVGILGTCPSVDGATPTYLQSSICGCFFECSNGVAYPFKCSANLQFNPLLDVCDYYSDECTPATPPAFPTGCPYQDVNHACPSEDVPPAYFASFYCGCYFRCSNGIAISYRCPPNLQFDPSKNYCVPSDGSCEPVPV